jgi:hypothetical protein
MNVEIGTEDAQFRFWEHINRIFVVVRGFANYHVLLLTGTQTKKLCKLREISGIIVDVRGKTTIYRIE